MEETNVGYLEKADAPPSLPWIIFASSCGTLIEWYDFFLYQTMAVFFGSHFFPQSDHNRMLGVLLSMATLGTGFAIRPLGGLLFGSLGDRIGRKYTFLMTLMLMGVATTCMGLLPTFSKIGYIAPSILLCLRVLQGLAAGGETGGACTYVVEHAPERQRGWYMGILYTTSPIGTVLALGVVYVCRNAMDAAAFDDWGWRIPFLLSGLLVLISLYLRMRLRETPIFAALRQTHQHSTSPVRELFTNRENIVRMVSGVFGSTSGQAALGITALAYSLSFMQAILKIDIAVASGAFFIALVAAIPFYLFFGWLSDKVGRRPMIILGTSCGVVFYVPLYMAMKWAANPIHFWMLTFLNWAQVLFVAMTLAPVMAYVSELFPARVRTTAVSVTYNLSNGLLNGFSPLIAFSIIASTRNIYLGLAYPMLLALITALVSLFFSKETYRTNLRSEISTGIINDL